MFTFLKNLYLKIEKYLAYHVDFLIGLNNLLIGWSILLGPESTVRERYFLVNVKFLGILLLVSGCVLILISVSDAIWKTEYYVFIIPPALYIYQIMFEVIFKETGSGRITTRGYIFLVTTLFIVCFVLMRRTGIRR